MTMPAPDDDERDAHPLGSDTSAPDDDAAGGVAGASYPPEETEPDASATAR